MIMEIYLRHSWLVDLALLVLIMAVGLRLIGSSPADAMRVVCREVTELCRREWTVGALNALAMILVFVIGIALVVAEQTTAFLQWLGMATEAGRGASSRILVVILLDVIVILFSLRTALADGQRGRRNR